jgi:hypothetical protein
MSVIQKQEIAMLSWWDSYPFVFILEGCSKWLGPGDLDKFTTVERDMSLEEMKYFAQTLKNCYSIMI